MKKPNSMVSVLTEGAVVPLAYALCEDGNVYRLDENGECGADEHGNYQPVPEPQASQIKEAIRRRT